MHLHLVPHLGMLDEPREGRDVGAKPKDGVWWTYTQVLGWEILPKRVSSNKH